MRKAKRAVLDALDKAALTHNCWAILDDAVTCGDDDRFTQEYIEGERHMLADAIAEEIIALTRLGKLYDIGVGASIVTLRKREEIR